MFDQIGRQRVVATLTFTVKADAPGDAEHLIWELISNLNAYLDDTTRIFVLGSEIIARPEMI